MKVSYYPGCSLDGSAREYAESLKSTVTALDIEMEELPDWTCCGASSAHATDDGLAVDLALRNLDIASKIGRDILVPCAACYSRLKKAEKKFGVEKPGGEPHGQSALPIRIKHSADFIWEECGEKAIAKTAKKSLAGLNPVCYYGCLITRPPGVTDAREPEDPQSMDNILKSLGAGVKNWSYKTDCCGGNLILTQPGLALALTKKLFDMAMEAGADCIVVGCPMCHSNLDTRQKAIQRIDNRSYNLPVYYFTELMGLAFGDKSARKWVSRHLTDARTLLEHKQLL